MQKGDAEAEDARDQSGYLRWTIFVVSLEQITRQNLSIRWRF